METGLEGLTDQQVEEELKRAVTRERESIARVIRCLIEFGEVRRLHGKRAFPSLFEYCTNVLGYSEAEAYKRTRVAAVAKDRREVIACLESGRTSLSKLVVIAHLVETGPAQELLDAACRLSKRDLEFFVAGLAPRVVAKGSVRVLPTRPAVAPPPASPAEDAALPPGLPPGLPPATVASTAPPPSTVAALTEQLARIAVTVDRVTLDRYRRACDLLRVRASDGGRVFARAIEALLREIDPNLALAAALTQRPRPSDPRSRHIPRHVRAEVWRRYGGQCAFRDEAGKRCTARTRLQIDHIRPWAADGRSDDPDNLRLLCPLHNGTAARDWFGDAFIDAKISERREQTRKRKPPG